MPDFDLRPPLYFSVQANLHDAAGGDLYLVMCVKLYNIQVALQQVQG